MEFKDRNIVVTGGTGALGSAVVQRLLAAGATVRIPVFDAEEGLSFKLRDQVTLVPDCDLSREEDVARLYDGMPDLWASIHIAGGFAMDSIENTGRAALMRMLDMNLVSCHLCCRAAVAAFGPRAGRIVNVAARPAMEPRGGAGMTAYVASKAAVAALTQALGAEVVSRGILVNAVAPSIIDTPANRAGMPDARHEQWPKPDEIAATIAFLASPANQVTAGAVVPVYGRA
jgi:NAD(P)-dependent dehydrogenase (short-subunit alcohol dehydrogenase family)